MILFFCRVVVLFSFSLRESNQVSSNQSGSQKNLLTLVSANDYNCVRDLYRKKVIKISWKSRERARERERERERENENEKERKTRSPLLSLLLLLLLLLLLRQKCLSILRERVSKERDLTASRK